MALFPSTVQTDCRHIEKKNTSALRLARMRISGRLYSHITQAGLDSLGTSTVDHGETLSSP